MPKRKPKQRTWQPMERGVSATPEAFDDAGIARPDEVWASDLYTVHVRYGETTDGTKGTRQGLLHLSIHRHDRHPIRDWRHLQSIKNEIAGFGRTAVELFPPEEYLVDSANEFHLWVLPVGVDLPFGMTRERFVGDAREAREATGGKGRQRDWQPGLSTGPDWERAVR